MSLPSWKARARLLLVPLVAVLVRMGVTPTAITLFGLALHIVSAVCIGYGNLVLGAAVLVAASICDAVDGAVARATGRVTRFGAFLDSNVDRLDETAVLAGIVAYFLRPGSENDVVVVITTLALAGSLITSYARARAEGLGLECKVGVFERPERVVLTVLGLFLGRRVLIAAVVVLAFLSWVTVFQRLRHVQRLLARSPAAPDPPAGHPAEPSVR